MKAVLNRRGNTVRLPSSVLFRLKEEECVDTSELSSSLVEEEISVHPNDSTVSISVPRALLDE